MKEAWVQYLVRRSRRRERLSTLFCLENSCKTVVSPCTQCQRPLSDFLIHKWHLNDIKILSALLQPSWRPSQALSKLQLRPLCARLVSCFQLSTSFITPTIPCISLTHMWHVEASHMHSPCPPPFYVFLVLCRSAALLSTPKLATNQAKLSQIGKPWIILFHLIWVRDCPWSSYLSSP